MRIIGVIDIQGGVVVRGIAGRRHEYRPLASPLCSSADPVEVVQALRAHFDLHEFYLADLDAIAGSEPAWDLYRDLHALMARLWVDAGVRTVAHGRALAEAGVETVVVGLETVAGPDVLAQLVCELGHRLVFSLDLREGQPLGDLAPWSKPDPLGIAGEAIACGVRRLLLLDLARVGVGAGTGTEELCRRLVETHSEVEIIVGGGVRGRDDLERLRQAGASAVLIASALHDGRLTPADVRS